MKLSTIFAFVGGFGAGFLVAREVFKAQIKEIEQEMIDQHRKDKEKMDQMSVELADKIRKTLYTSDNDAEEVDKKEEESYFESQKHKNYSKMYHRTTEKPEKETKITEKIEDLEDFDDIQEAIAAEDQEIEEDLEERRMLELNEKIDSESNRDPIVISPDEIGDIIDGCYEEEVLYYYALNDTLTDEFDDPVDDDYELIGNCLEDSGILEISGLNREIYVQNFKLQMIYRVIIFEREYELV